MKAKEYRKNYKAYMGITDNKIDLDFIGCIVRKNNEIIKKGFINITHGDKPNERGFIESQVTIAEDGQAVYEFLQNAVDADSSEFYVYYDEKNFCVINNGSKFSIENVRSILNFSQSTKSEKDNKIGRFGVGFKLIHRLVGKESGIDEIIDQYKGPVLFSWDNFYLKKFVKNDFIDIDNHWLFKIIYTNFPCGVNETILGANCESINPFKDNEVNEIIRFLSNKNINMEVMEQGSLFFLKLGDQKINVCATS